MSISFYDISVASYLQTLGGVAGFLDKGAEHAAASGADANEIVGARLSDDMWPFRDQIFSVTHHSLGCIRGIENGLFQPPELDPTLDYAGCQQLVADTIAALQGYGRDEVDALADKPMQFKASRFELSFATAADFVASFSLPNFYFHATTAYDLLRMRGTPIGKLNYMGQLRVQG